MIQRFINYFLEGFKSQTETEKRTAGHLLLTTVSVMSMFIIFFSAHLFFGLSHISLFANFLGIAGTALSLLQFRTGNIRRAGLYLIWVIILAIVLYVFADFQRTDPAIRYRLYVTFVSILGLYFVFISFYRNKKQLFNFSFVFIGILTLHFIVILYKLQGDKINQLFTLQHYSVTVFGILLTTIISSLMISVLEELQQQTVAQKEIIERQNTELKKTLEKQARFLMLGNENLKEFAAITSHDLKEPLRNISGFVSLIKRKIEPEAISQNQELQEYFEFVQSGVKKMEVLIHDIGDYSSINILEKNFADVDMNALIKNVIHTFDQQIAGKNITIDVQRLPAVWGDKTLLFALFQKLISNAIRFRNNEMPCYILIGTESGDNQVSFFIKDNGVGISEEYLQKIFAPFRKLKGDTDSKTSSGLGLATCKKIIEIHNGEIWAESKAGSGSVFYFKIGKN